MKKFLFLLLIFLCNNIRASAQGIYKLWGMTQAGGNDNNGTIFTTDYAGNNFSQRYQFNNIVNSGGGPEGDIMFFNGKYYGLTVLGGEENKGVLFEWDPVTNVYTRKIEFLGPNGEYPQATLTGFNGKLYGVTESGGYYNHGTIFEWNPATNVLSKKADFDLVAHGYYPLGKLTVANGKLYGLAWGGGFFNTGCIYEFDPATNVLTNKKDLDNTTGCNPYHNGLTLAANGKFYGMMTSGGSSNKGCLFEWDPITDLYQKKIDFDGVNGGTPSGNLFEYNNKYYGVTRFGGTGNRGVVFEWDPVTNVYSVKISFDGVNGSEPTGSLSFYNGNFYGLSHDGGTNGTLFKWDPVANICTAVVSLTDSTGGTPYGTPFLSGTKFYGMTSNGGTYRDGTIFEFDPGANAFTKKIDFNGTTNSKNPRGTLIKAGPKFYGVASKGGLTNDGVIFEWTDGYPGYQKKIECNVPDGSMPYSNLVFHGNKYYGTTTYGGDYFFGTLFTYHPDSVSFVKKIQLDGNNGSKPFGDLTFIGDKAYGLTSEGGSNGAGVIYEWDVATNIITKKADFDSYYGGNPTGNMVLYNGKFYGTTQVYCGSNVGGIFEWDPITNVIIKKLDFSVFNGGSPNGTLSLFNGKFYGLASYGGSSFGGAIFEWDPATNEFNTKINLTPALGTHPKGSLTLSGNKFYGVTYDGGANDLGVVFEWDPVTNIYTVKKDFSGIDGANPSFGNDLVKYPSAVASGVANTCTSFPPVTIDNSNNNVWVPIIDNRGNAVAEIKANGNNLGVVNTSMYINDGPVREDGAHRLYLDRNLTITPAVQPSSPVNVRLYLKASEYEALKNAVNSLGQPSGINSINDVGFFKNNEGCLPVLQNTASQVVVTGEAWDNDYVITATISGFSSFYAASKLSGQLLSLRFLDFTAKLENTNAVLQWTTANESNTHSFDIQRSIDGNSFITAGTMPSHNLPGQQSYSFIDKDVPLLKVEKLYYRLKQKDNDGKFSFSKILPLSLSPSTAITYYPNPVRDILHVEFGGSAALGSKGVISDMQGRIIKTIDINAIQQKIDVSDLAAGMYILKIIGQTSFKFYKR